MMLQWWMICFFFLIKLCFINCKDYQCNYTITKSDNSTEKCFNNQCYEYLDIISIMVEPNTCKTSLLFLSFSFYKKFTLFRDQLQWKLGDLFPSGLLNENRLLILFIDYFDYDDKPFDYDELIRLGINIDFYIIYIRHIQNEMYLSGSRHYDPKYPEWDFIKLKLRCLQLSAFDKYPCSGEILSPSVFAPQRPFKLTTTKMYFPTEKSITKSNEEKKNSTDLILIIFLPILSIFISIILLILIYKCIVGNCCVKTDETVTPKSPSLTNTSNHLDNTERISSSSSLSNSPTVPKNKFNGGQLQNPIENPNYHQYTKPHLTNSLNNNYERGTLDAISLHGQQCFVLTSSTHF